MYAWRLVLVVAAMVVAAPLAAQQGPPGGRPGGMGQGRGDPAVMQARQNEMLFNGITLSAEQRAKVDSIQAHSRAQQQEMMQAGGAMRDPETRQRMMQQRQATMAAIRGVLTPEQQAKFDANVAAMPGPQGGGRPPRR